MGKFNKKYLTKKPTKGVIYTRFSCDKQREESTIGQIRECKAFAKANKITIIGIYKDEAVSGTTDQRPAFLKMIADSRSHDFDCVIVWKNDRFARNMADSASYKKYLADEGIRVLYATEPNLEGSASILVNGITDVYSEFFSHELSEKVLRGMTENALSGKFNGGNMPFGYTLDDDHRVTVEPFEAKCIQEMYDLYLNHGKSVAEITQILKDRGVKGKWGEPISNGTIHRILGDEKYAGIYSFNDVEANGYYPAIVPLETVKAVRKQKKKNISSRSSFNSKEKYLLAGKAYCGECGKLLVGVNGRSKTGKKYRYYVCLDAYRKKVHELPPITKDVLEKVVALTILQYIAKKADREYLIKSMLEHVQIDCSDLEAYEKKIKALEKKIASLLDYMEDNPDDPDIAKRLEARRQEKSELEGTILSEKRERGIFNKDAVEAFLGSYNPGALLDEETMFILFNKYLYRVYVTEDWKIAILLKTYDYMDEKGELSEVRKALHIGHQFETSRTLYCHQSGFVVVGYLPQRKSHKTSHP